MTDAIYCHYEDVVQRSKLKNSAKHKANGSAVTKLGNRRMTDKEIKEKHSECKEWCLDGFMDFSDFESMQNDLKIEYVNKLMDKYDIQLKDISKWQFNKGFDGLRANFRNVYKCLDKVDYQKARAGSGLLQYKKELEEWRQKMAEIARIDAEERKAVENIVKSGDFITVEQFLAFDPNQQLRWVNAVIDRYDVSTITIGKYLFGKHVTWIRDRIEEHHKLQEVHKCKIRGTKGTENIAKFDAAVKIWKGEPMEEPVEEIIPSVKVEELPTPEEVEESIAEVAKKLNAILKDKGFITGADVNKELPFNIPEETVVAKMEPEKNIAEEEPKSHDNPIPEETAVSKDWEITFEPHDVNQFTYSFKKELEAEKNKPEDDPMIYHDASFTSRYVSIGVDENELEALKLMFRGKKVRVSIDITVI